MRSNAPFALPRRIVVLTDRRPGLHADRALPRTEAGDRREADGVVSSGAEKSKRAAPVGNDPVVRLLL